MNLLLDPNTLWVLSSSVLLGVSSGVLGSFALLRRRSLLGDALAHAALPGIGIAFILTGAKSLPMLLLGAIIAGLLGAFVIQAVTRHTRVKEDAALGLVLSVFFAFGIVLLTKIQHSGAGNQSGLDKFLFGQAASMIGSDVQVMAVSAAAVCLLAVFLFKEFKLLCFDAQFAAGLGFSPRLLDGLLMVLIVTVVVIGMQAVGVVLMAAMLITPAAAARLWTDRLNLMVWLAAGMGAASGAVGTWLSTMGLRMPTGPLIVIAASAMFGISLVFAPRRGIIANIMHIMRTRARVGRENALRALYEIAEKRGQWDYGAGMEEVAEQRGSGLAAIRTNIHRLERDNLVRSANGGVSLTEEGQRRAYAVVRKHRLWEMYLMHQSLISADHVDREADEIEHFLPADVIQRLEDLLQAHQLELKLPPSVHPIE